MPMFYRPEIGSLVADTVTCPELLDDAIASYAGGPVAVDTETKGFDSFAIRCVTLSWWVGPDLVCSILTDPLRRPEDHGRTRKLIDAADTLVFQGSPYDVPGMFHHGLLDGAAIDKVLDTLVYAAMAYPDPMIRKKLEALVVAHLDWKQLSGGMGRAFRAAGFRTISDGYSGMDIDTPTYRMGAINDTAGTLRLLPKVKAAAIARTLDHPFKKRRGITDPVAAAVLVHREQRVNRVMLAANARGFAVNLDAIDAECDRLHAQIWDASEILVAAGIRPGVGQDLVNRLDDDGMLPLDWPRTPKTRKLAATKKELSRLEDAPINHPLALAHRAVVKGEQGLTYMKTIDERRAGITGRVHPMTYILGATKSGRMTMEKPQLHQFPPSARPVLAADAAGFTSIDFSQIEPTVLANMAGDIDFLAPFEAGADLYEPIMRYADITRPIAKIVLLADMYGQGDASLARSLNVSEERANQLRRRMHLAMPKTREFIEVLQRIARQHQRVVTLSGRILTIPTNPKQDNEVMSYLSTNYSTQGSAYDVLAEAILRVADAGYGSSIRLALHDELLIDSTHAEQIAALMVVPPQALIDWTGRVPVLRCASKDLGDHWKKED